MLLINEKHPQFTFLIKIKKNIKIRGDYFQKMRLIAFLMLILLSSYISSPAHVPNFDNFTTPVIEPGKVGIFNFTIQNRYAYPMEDVLLNIEIYMWATENEHLKINKVRDAPVIQESGEYKYTLHLGTIEGGELKVVRFHIKTFSHTPDGVYFVRFSIFFNYNGSLHKMWSPGYFSREVWDNATRNHTLNLTNLSKAIGEPVDGIVPDSSFSVKRSLMWIFYVLLGITIFVGILAFYTYFREEGKIRKEEENIYRLKGKYRYLEKELREKLKKIRNQ